MKSALKTFLRGFWGKERKLYFRLIHPLSWGDVFDVVFIITKRKSLC